jgi:hypothetical protein
LRGVYWLGLLAAVIAFADATAYLMLVSPSPNEWDSVIVIAAMTVLAGVLATAGSLATGRTRAGLLWPATAILLVLGYLAAHSIGAPLFFAGMVTGVGARRAMRERPPSRPPALQPRSASSRP